MVTVRKCKVGDYSALVEVWERSVRSSHDFLQDSDICEIRGKLETSYFPAVDLSCIELDGVIAGFIGISGNMIEMLFVDGEFRGRGLGSMLMDIAISVGAVFVDVNEQNRSALTFYMGKGFRVVSRDETDSDGRHYPILHLSL